MFDASTSIRENPRPDLRRKLLDSAERLFSEKSYSDVRVDDIAADAGVAKGLVYYHFQSKRGIYEAVVRAMSEDLMSRTVANPELPPYERTAAVLDGFIGWATEVERFTLSVSRSRGVDPMVMRAVNYTIDHHAQRMLEGVKEVAAEMGVESAADSPAMRHAIKGWVAFVWTVTIDWLGTHDMPEEDLRDLFLRALGGSITAARDTHARGEAR